MPAIQYLREFVAAGGLMSYSGSAVEYHNVAGRYTGRILSGEKPADLAVQQPTKTELSINVATAKAFGIAIPQPLLARADEISCPVAEGECRDSAAMTSIASRFQMFTGSAFPCVSGRKGAATNPRK
jgi:hypothetical protein